MSEITNIGDFRATNKGSKPKKCSHKKTVYCEQYRTITCEDCKKILDPFDTFVSMVEQWGKQIKSIDDCKKTLREWEVRLRKLDDELKIGKEKAKS